MALNRQKIVEFSQGIRHAFALKTSSATPGRLLLLYLPGGWPEQGDVHWAWRDENGNFTEGRTPRLEEIPRDALSGKVAVWTPGADTLLTTTSVPTRSRAKILQALPFALEDQLLGEPEAMHFAYRTLGGGRLAVAVTARERLDHWLEQLQFAGIRPTSVCPVTLALPWVPETWSVAFLDQDLVVRTDRHAGFDCLMAGQAPPAMLVAAIEEARKSGAAPQELHVFNAPAEFDGEQWAAALELRVTVHDESVFQHASLPASINLLHAGFGAGGQFRPIFRRLRPAVIMLGIWFVAGFSFNAFEWWQLSHAAQDQREEMTAHFRKSFPDAKVVVDPALQMQRNLEELQARSGAAGRGDLLALLGDLAPIVQARRGAQIQGLQYADKAINVDLHVDDFEALEAVRNALTAKGLQVEVLSSNSRGAGVDGRLRVSAGKRT